MAHTVIIGAGLTGLSTAYHLEKRGFYDYTLLEKNSEPGGLCGSITQDGFTFDYTGHLLHINNPYFKDFICSLIGLDFFNKIDRKSYIYSYNRYTPYPYQMNLHGLPASVITDCIEGFVERNKYTLKKNKPHSFKDWALTHFGSGFAKHFFTTYQEKIFSHPIESITSSWTSRFVPSTTLKDILHGAFHEKKHTKSVGYNAQFYYPKSGGIVSWIHKVAHAIKKPIITDCTVTQIDTNKKVIYTHTGDPIPYDHLINTMPLNTLLATLKEKPSMDCKKAAKKLLCNSVLNFNLGIHIPSLTEKHWIYYPEKKYPFYRLGFPHNLSTHMTPQECSSLYGEIAYTNSSRAELYELYNTARIQVKKLLNFNQRDIMTEKIIHIPHAYVTFDFWREKNLSKVLTALKNEAIHSIGRYGAWKYASMQEAVLDGKHAADAITFLPARKENPITPHIHKGNNPCIETSL